MTPEHVAADTIFRDRELLSPDFRPEERLVNREEELANIEYAVNPMIFGRQPDNLLIAGPTGVGKTACVAYSARRQIRYAQEQRVRAGCAYLDCLATSTGARAARELAGQLNDPDGTGVEVPERGLSTDEYYDRLRAVLDERYDAAVVVLDRLDRLETDQLPLLLGRLDADGGSSCIAGVVGIVDDNLESSSLDDDVRRVVGQTECEFDPYETDRLVEILDRRRDAFVDGALEPGTLRRAAQFGVEAGGDAGRAIAVLRRAGDVASDRGAESVTPADVHTAAGRVDHVRTRDRLRALEHHSRLALLALASLAHGGERNAFRTTRIYSAYVEYCRDRDERPRSERRVLDFLNDHADLGLTAQTTHWGGRADGNYKTHRLVARPDTVIETVDKPAGSG